MQALRNALRQSNDGNRLSVEARRIQKNEIACAFDRIKCEERQIAIVFAIGTSGNKGGLPGDPFTEVMANDKAGFGIDLEYRIESRRRRVGYPQCSGACR